MILLAETPVKYRDGTVKSLDELGGEAKELAPDTPVVNGSTSKPLDEFIQDQIVLSPDTPVVVDEEDTTTLEDYIEDTVGVEDLVHKTGTETITGTKTFREEIRVETPGSLFSPLTKYEADAIESNAQDFIFTGQGKMTIDSDLDVDGDLTLTGEISRGFVSVNSDGVKTRAQLLNELFALIDMTKITYSSKFVVGFMPFRVGYLRGNTNNTTLTFTISDFDNSLGPVTGAIALQNGSSLWKEYYGNTFNDLSDNVFPDGSRVAIYY